MKRVKTKIFHILNKPENRITFKYYRNQLLSVSNDRKPIHTIERIIGDSAKGGQVQI